MRFNFRKIASVLTSAAMIGSTIALAAAANYADPFIKSGAADVAVVWGSTAATTDLLAVTEITNKLSSELAKQTASGGSVTTAASVTGEASPLFTSGTKLYINDTLNTVKTVLTKTELPTVLADNTFSGNVDAAITQVINLGGVTGTAGENTVQYAKQPTSSNDPELGLGLSTSTARYIYNTSISFGKAVNFTHADSKGQDMTLLGQKFTVASATDNTNLVLLKTAEKISLSSDSPTAEVTISGKKYTVELVSASDTAATVRVTDENGNSETKEINENASKKVQGITVAITNADETNLKLSASVIAGAEKVTLTNGASVTKGEDDTPIDGTYVNFTGSTNAMTKIVVRIVAKNSDNDAILAGDSFIDPVFGTFKLNFAGLNIGSNDTTSKEDVVIKHSGDDKMTVEFTDSRGNTKNFQWARNLTLSAQLQHDDGGLNISLVEEEPVFRNEMLMVGNKDDGRLLKLTQVYNDTGTEANRYSKDKIKFQDVFSGESYESTITSEGSGTVTIGGKVYDVRYFGSADASEDTRSVRLNHPDSTAAGSIVLFPTIQTSKGAKFMLYKPINLTLHNFDGKADGGASYVRQIRIPNGDTYTDITVGNSTQGVWNFTAGGTTRTVNLTANSADQANNLSVGRLTFTITGNGSFNGNPIGGANGGSSENASFIYLVNPRGGNIVTPAIVLLNEKDDNSNYEATIITLETGATSDDGLGVGTSLRTWGGDTTWESVTLASNSKKLREIDVWGTTTTLDDADSDQRTATISYPDEQIYAQIYGAANAAEILAGTTSSGATSVKELGSVTVTDEEIATVSTKNLIVVGGSCVNKVAAKLLGSDSALCGADFTTKTDVSSGQFLIETFASPYSTGKVATLVAGYDAGDTTNAAKYLNTQTVDTTAGKKYTGTSATSASLVTANTSA